MKSIESRLQSRISKRRNIIRQVEVDVAIMKAQRGAMRALGFARDDYCYIDVAMNIQNGREFVKVLADDQKLDKRLRTIVLERAQLFGLRDI